MTAVPHVVLVADDDHDDQLLALDAFSASARNADLRFVSNGEELLEYLTHTGRYTAPGQAPTPALVLLDLNMPRMDGREALKRIKATESLRRIPIVIMTSSEAEEDVVRSYDLGANSYLLKPSTFDGLVETIRSVSNYWLTVVVLSPSA